MTDIFDNLTNVNLFDKNMTIFYNSLLETFPEFKHNIGRSYKFYKKCEKKEYINILLSSLEPHINLISNYDEGIFSNDYQEGSMCLLKGLDFKLIFKFINDNTGDDENQYSEDEALRTKKSIFNHFQSIYLSAQMAQGKISDFNNVMNNQKELFIGMLKNLNINETLKDKIKELESEDTSWGGLFDKFIQLWDIVKDIFGEFSDIFDINIMNELNDAKDTTGGISKKLTKKIMEIAKNMAKKIKNKFMSGSISFETLKEKFKLIVAKVKELWPDFDFDSIIESVKEVAKNNGIDIEKMTEESGGQDGGEGNEDNAGQDSDGQDSNGQEDNSQEDSSQEDEADSPEPPKPEEMSKMMGDLLNKGKEMFGDFLPKEITEQMENFNIEELMKQFTENMKE